MGLQQQWPTGTSTNPSSKHYNNNTQKINTDFKRSMVILLDNLNHLLEKC